MSCFHLLGYNDGNENTSVSSIQYDRRKLTAENNVAGS